MKRSEINTILCEGRALLESKGFFLPPFAYWEPAQWKDQDLQSSDILNNHLGWDITDFGSGDYQRIGLLLFTLRNGSHAEMRSRSGRLYCEKIAGVNQVTPLHYHKQKYEDIINRGGGRLIVQLHNPTPDMQPADTDVSVKVDGVSRTVKAGQEIALQPGESITLPPFLYHAFWGEGLPVLAGEVSLVNDDVNDNFFLAAKGRFPQIEEDEPPLHLLVGDYPRFVNEKDDTKSRQDNFGQPGLL